MASPGAPIKGVALTICLQNEFDKLHMHKKRRKKRNYVHVYIFFPESEERG